MTFVETLLLALALCVDSLVVSATTTLRHRLGMGRGLLMAVVFALCQGAFPLVGALVGDAARSFVEVVDHWIAFGLLAFVGGKMVVDGLRADPQEGQAGSLHLAVGTMFVLGVATSIDALAVGIGLGLQYAMSEVVLQVAVVAITTLVVSIVGVWLGRRQVPLPERTATILAGVVLIGLGTKILLEHLLF